MVALAIILQATSTHNFTSYQYHSVPAGKTMSKWRFDVVPDVKTSLKLIRNESWKKHRFWVKTVFIINVRFGISAFWKITYLQKLVNLIYCNYRDCNALFQDNVVGHPDITNKLKQDVKLFQTMSLCQIVQWGLSIQSDIYESVVQNILILGHLIWIMLL